jgi:hypothetical protein
VGTGDAEVTGVGGDWVIQVVGVDGEGDGGTGSVCGDGDSVVLDLSTRRALGEGDGWGVVDRDKDQEGE